MKKLCILLITSALTMSVLAQEKQISALFGHATFCIPESDKAYVETYLSFDAWTMNFVKTDDNRYRATAEVTIVATAGDSVCFWKKYNLNSPTVDDTNNLGFNFIDLQRFPIGNGIYNLSVTIRDVASSNQPSSVSEKLVVRYESDKPAISSLQLISKATKTTEENAFSRRGYDMEPYINDFLPENIEQIGFYYEVYNIDVELGTEKMLTCCYIENYETGSRVTDLLAVARHKCTKTVPVYGSIDLSRLPSGHYNLVVEVRNRDGEKLMYEKLPFFRSNPSVEPEPLSDYATTFAAQYTDTTTLNTYIDALYAISSPQEIKDAKRVMASPSVEKKQAYLYNFWASRNTVDPAGEWYKYRELVDYVIKEFSYPLTPGPHTDRGRVYLQYGPPDFVRDEKNFVGTKTETGNNEFSTNYDGSLGHIYYLPYQLWRYNQLPGDQPNRVFLFWDEFRSGYYKLLNSNARGEVRDMKWEQVLSNRQLQENAVGEVGKQFERGY
ncbi:MAG: GWxTD domain-containing protein [Bacteroidales bacterium]|nr:GWxTD domain-containing protein [Bacteroidales bacterium]